MIFETLEGHDFSDGRLVQLDGDTFAGPDSLEAALRGAGAGCLAVDRVMSGQARSVFSAMRPPGHHAEPDRAMGFCLFSNAAIAAFHAARKWPVKRVAVLDFDASRQWYTGSFPGSARFLLCLFPSNAALSGDRQCG